MSDSEVIIRAAVEATKRGFTPVPIRAEAKNPGIPSWGHLHWPSPEAAEETWKHYVSQGLTNVGLLLGEAHGSLVDVDLDHPAALKLRDYFLPPTAMQTGRVGRPRSHHWYLVEDDVPDYRPYKLPNGQMLVELRSSRGPVARHQTVIPPSIWTNADKVAKDPTLKVKREKYRWEGEPFGGKAGPARVNGKVLSVQVALLALGATLLDGWPEQGSRHEAYLALAGGLLRFGDGTHPWWAKNLPVLIEALADADNDEEGPGKRVAEVMGSTLTRLSEGGKAIGFGRLAEIIGPDHAEAARRRAKDVEALAGFVGQPVNRIDPVTGEVFDDDSEEAPQLPAVADDEHRNPLEERISSWAAVDLGPYLDGEVVLPKPQLLTRVDGHALFYPGKVNSLFGGSESGKSWVALHACVEEIAKGERTMYIDFEDMPEGTLARIQALGVGDFDIRNQFKYVHPEGPLADMQRSKYGARPTEDGMRSTSVFKTLLDAYDPTLIVADGMTVLYGLHALDSNDAMSTDVITSWLKSITRGGRTTVVVIDHTGKTSGPGSSPIGAHHKVAMVQGTALRVDPIVRPMPGAVGKIRLTVYKDRPGAVRAVSSNPGAKEQTAGIVTIDSAVENITRITIEPPSMKDSDDLNLEDSPERAKKFASLARAQKLQTKVLEMFNTFPELTTDLLMNNLGIDRDDAYSIWETLMGQKLIERHGTTRWTKYTLREAPRD